MEGIFQQQDLLLLLLPVVAWMEVRIARVGFGLFRHKIRKK